MVPSYLFIYSQQHRQYMSSTKMAGCLDESKLESVW